ncbi:MAG: O-antigen ligase family protein [Pseudomonadota bacterium]|nr:O-antigen ligase family protein [Pseudomonadota bacterium]
MNTSLVAATSAFLFLAPFAGSAGLRAGLLTIAGLLLLARARDLRPLALSLPRGVLAAFIAWALLATLSLAWSVDRAYTRGELKSEILYPAMALAIFYAAAALRPERWRLWWVALLAGSATMCAGLALQDFLPFALTRHSVLEQRGPWSTHLVLIAPLLFVLGWPRPWGAERSTWVQATALAVFLVAAWATHNRMVWIAFGVQLVLAMSVWRTTPAMAPTRTRDLRRLTVAAALVVAVAFATALVERNERFFGAKAPVMTSFERDLRPKIWSTAVEQWRAAPWLGHGFGREIVAGAFTPLTPRVPDHPEIRHAHNVFLDVAIELGVVGIATLLALLVLLAREYRGFLRRPEVAPLGVLGLTLLAGFVVKNLTDDFMHRHNALVFWALNGMLLGLGGARRAVEPKT